MIFRAFRNALVLILIGSLAAACEASAPISTSEPPVDATATLPAPEVVVTEGIPATEPTPLGKVALLASLAEHPVLAANNLEDLQFLGQFNLAEEPMTFETWAWSQDGRRLALCYSGETSRVEIHDLEDPDLIPPSRSRPMFAMIRFMELRTVSTFLAMAIC
jgi:hypothetical protein